MSVVGLVSATGAIALGHQVVGCRRSQRASCLKFRIWGRWVLWVGGVWGVWGWMVCGVVGVWGFGWVGCGVVFWSRFLILDIFDSY